MHREEITVKRRLLTRAETKSMGKVETFADGKSYELRVHIDRGIRHTKESISGNLDGHPKRLTDYWE